jgi:drug/metabolite transporter (DMT)-like permease
MWQIISALLCALNLFNTLLSDRDGNTLPFLQLAISYVLVLLTNIFRYERSDISWVRYLVCSVFTWGGDCSVVYAFNTTSLTSAMLLTTTTIFWVAPVTYFVLHRKISIAQLLSIIVGFGGMVVLFVADGIGASQWLGNVLAAISAFCYSIANVLQEDLVHRGSVTLFLSRFAIVSVPINLVLGAAVEWKDIRDYQWDTVTVVYLLAYWVLLAVWYQGSAFVMQFSNAIELNMSLLTTNFYSVVIAVAAFGQEWSWLYLVGFLCMPAGIVLYVLCPRKSDAGEEESDDEIMEKIVPEQQDEERMPGPST